MWFTGTDWDGGTEGFASRQSYSPTDNSVVPTWCSLFRLSTRNTFPRWAITKAPAKSNRRVGLIWHLYASTKFLPCRGQRANGRGPKIQGKLLYIVQGTVGQLDYSACFHAGGNQESGRPGAVQAKTRLTRYLWQASDG